MVLLYCCLIVRRSDPTSWHNHHSWRREVYQKILSLNANIIVDYEWCRKQVGVRTCENFQDSRFLDTKTFQNGVSSLQLNAKCIHKRFANKISLMRWFSGLMIEYKAYTCRVLLEPHYPARNQNETLVSVQFNKNRIWCMKFWYILES